MWFSWFIPGILALQLPFKQEWNNHSGEKTEYDILGSFNNTVDIRVPRGITINIPHEVIVNDLSSIIPTPPIINNALDIHQEYHQYETIETIFKSFEILYPSLTRTFVVGKSAQGRDIIGIRISNYSHPHPHTQMKKHGYDQKLGFVIVGGQHAREWISISTIIYLAHNLLVDARPEVARMLDIYEFILIPVLNPDGYVYTWTSDRLWKKTRQIINSPCVGVDLNRNWGYKWKPHSSPCSETWPGDEPFSAPESNALRQFIEDRNNHVEVFLDLHSYGQMFLIPYSYSCSDIPLGQEDLLEAGYIAAAWIRNLYGRLYQVGSVCQVSVSDGPGSSVDWTSGHMKIKWSFLTKLPDRLVYAPEFIKPTGEETFEMILGLGEFIAEKEDGKRHKHV